MNTPQLVPRKNQASVSFDFEAAAAAFAEKILRQKARRLALLFDSPDLSAHRVFVDSLRRELEGRHIEILPFYYDSFQIYNGAIAILEREPPVELVICSDPLRAEKLRQSAELLGAALPPLVSFGISETLRPAVGSMNGPMSLPNYEFDYRRLAQEVLTLIRSGKGWGQKTILKPKGFAPDRKKAAQGKWIAAAPQKIRELTLLTGTSPVSKILIPLIPYFRRRTGIQLKVAVLPNEDLFFLLSSGKEAHYDLIRIDMAWGARFEKELFMPLVPLKDAITPLTNSFLPSILRAYCPGGRELYTIPFDPTIQMLFYRKDIFENSTIKRLYYEKTRRRLEVPKTFADYNRAAAFFSSRINEGSPTAYGVTMSYGLATAAACEILPRIKSLGGEYFGAAGKIAVTTPLFQQALEEYLELTRYSSADVNYWWEGAVDSFTSGASAMTILFINRASDIIRANKSAFPIKAAVAPVPGGFPLLGGGSLGISGHSRNIETCVEFLNWVYSDEAANIITMLGGLSPCRSVFENEEILEVYPWLRNILDYFSTGFRKSSSRVYPHFDNYHFERILGSAVRNAAMGLISPAEALENAQRQCEAELKRG
jgi:multiple sugar transport system substrate-binding protein